MSAPIAQRFKFSDDALVQRFVTEAVWSWPSPYCMLPGAELLNARQIIEVAIAGFGPAAIDLQAITVH